MSMIVERVIPRDQPEWEVRRRVTFGTESVCLCWNKEDAERIARMLRSPKKSLCEKEKRQ